LKLLLGTGLIVIALSFLKSPDKHKIKALNEEIKQLYPKNDRKQRW